MTPAEQIAADFADVLTAGELSRPVTVRRPGEPDADYPAIVADLDDGSELQEAAARSDVLTKRVVIASAARLLDGTQIVIDGYRYAVTGAPLNDPLTGLLSALCIRQGKASTGDTNR